MTGADRSRWAIDRRTSRGADPPVIRNVPATAATAMSLSPSNKPDRLARLEARHLELLRALDELNVRVEEVLREFTRTDAQSQGVEGN